MTQLSLRLRLTLLVTAAFVMALLVAGTIARQRLEATLIDTARTNAEATLIDSFSTEAAIGSVPAGVVSVEPVIGGSGSAGSATPRAELTTAIPGGAATSAVQGVTRFVFTDSEGVELSQQAFASLVNDATAAELAELGFFLETGGLIFDDLITDPANVTSIETGFPDSVTVFQPIQAVGEPTSSETDEEIIVSQAVQIGDEELVISLSSPRQPLNDSLTAFTYLGLAMIPLLGIGVALATWLTTSRVLRPVEDIRRQVEQTDSNRLGLHVPRSMNGDEIDRLAGTMNDMLDRLRVASERQRQFVSDASHELRSPITATLATLETTDADHVSAHWPEIAATLTTEQHRLARLVDNLLFLATVDEGRASSPFSDVDLDELVLAEAVRPHLVEVSAQIDAPHRITGSTPLLQRCIGNLVENAARHASSAVSISLETSMVGQPVIRVVDDGPGIPDDRLESIFERFIRVDDARTRSEGGAGLGLSIARDIAKQHAASLTASNLPSGGACFELVFAPAASLET